MVHALSTSSRNSDSEDKEWGVVFALEFWITYCTFDLKWSKHLLKLTIFIKQSKHSLVIHQAQLGHSLSQRGMNILITHLFDPLAEQLNENKGYHRHKSEIFHQSNDLRECVAAKLRPSRDPWIIESGNLSIFPSLFSRTPPALFLSQIDILFLNRSLCTCFSTSFML